MTADRPATRRNDAAALYFGEVMHARLKPMGHRFSYRVMSLLIDLDRLDDADRQSPLFGVNRAALYSFHEADHGAARRLLAARLCASAAPPSTASISPAAGCCCSAIPACSATPSIRCRSISAIAPTGRLHFIIYEVRNTFGEIHPYVLPVRAGERQRGRRAAGSRTSCSMSRRLWTWRCAITSAISPPGEQVKLRILETDREGPLLAATFIGRRRGAHDVARCCALSSPCRW